MGHDTKLRIQLKSNWIFSEVLLLIYMYILYVYKLAYNPCKRINAFKMKHNIYYKNIIN